MHFSPIATESSNFLETEMKMDFKLNIFTLNCWGIIGVSRHRKERMAAVAAHIASSKYDFVFLQEVWSKEDFQMICKKTAAVLPYSHYFYSGVIGSGLGILSRSSIHDSAQYPYTLNGFAHKVLHGDWFGGKVVGMCKVKYHGLNINLYITHLHAEYDNLHDQYLSHRIVQAFEFSQFVKMTSESADLCIVAGDFNAESHDLPYQLIVNNTGCTDSFLSSLAPKDVDMISATCGHPDNLYTSQNELHEYPNGKRIDYVMYKCRNGTSAKCLCCETPLTKIPNSCLPYSDHEAVVSKLHIFKSANVDEANCESTNPASALESLNGSREILAKTIQELGINRRFHFAMCCIAVLIIFITVFIRLPHIYDIFLKIVLLMSAVVFVFCFWMATVMNRIEYNALISCTNSMEILINALVSEYGFELPIRPTETGYALDSNDRDPT